MKVRFTPEAETQTDESDTWWREHRDVRDPGRGTEVVARWVPEHACVRVARTGRVALLLAREAEPVQAMACVIG